MVISLSAMCLFILPLVTTLTLAEHVCVFLVIQSWFHTPTQTHIHRENGLVWEDGLLAINQEMNFIFWGFFLSYKPNQKQRQFLIL